MFIDKLSHNTKLCSDMSYESQGEFEIQSRYYIHFWTTTLRKGMNLLMPPAMGYKVSLLFFCRARLCIK